MKHLNRQVAVPAGSRHLLLSLPGVAALITPGCNSERDGNGGETINNILLDRDAVQGLPRENLGIHPDTCVLDKPENPFSSTFIPEFDTNYEGPSKFDLANQLRAVPAGANSRFYFRATALARRGSVKSQYVTALALHELFTANSNVLREDELIRDQALKAYRSALDNFFDSVLASPV